MTEALYTNGTGLQMWMQCTFSAHSSSRSRTLRVAHLSVDSWCRSCYRASHPVRIWLCCSTLAMQERAENIEEAAQRTGPVLEWTRA